MADPFRTDIERRPDAFGSNGFAGMRRQAKAGVLGFLKEFAEGFRPGTPLGDPGHIRVSYGTADENGRFLAAMAELLA